jgi:hypothetical protein
MGMFNTPNLKDWMSYLGDSLSMRLALKYGIARPEHPAGNFKKTFQLGGI